MEVIKIKGDKITLDLTEGEVNVLLEYAVNNILKDYIDSSATRNKKCTACGSTGLKYSVHGRHHDKFRKDHPNSSRDDIVLYPCPYCKKKGG